MIGSWNNLIFIRIDSDFNKLRLEFMIRFWYPFGELVPCTGRRSRLTEALVRIIDDDVQI
jgi:hypothetical protein